MSGYASKAEAMAVVRATIAGSNRPADLPDDLSVYILSRIYAAVITSRGPGYGWGIEYDAATFWDAVRANLRDNLPPVEHDPGDDNDEKKEAGL